MTQLHAISHGIGAPRPTNDVDIVLHIETTPNVANTAAAALEQLGYELADTLDSRKLGTAHRFQRVDSSVDLVTSKSDIVDVLVADHAAPSEEQRLRGRTMVAIDGGTQALKRTINVALEIDGGGPTVNSVPIVLGAIILKVAAFKADSRDPKRHLLDAAVLLAAISDPYELKEQFAGSDRSRIRTLTKHLPDGADEWKALSARHRDSGQAALRILAAV